MSSWHTREENIADSLTQDLPKVGIFFGPLKKFSTEIVSPKDTEDTNQPTLRSAQEAQVVRIPLVNYTSLD